MIAVDTNVVVRLLVGDDKAQFQAARRVFHDHDVFIAETVILETVWVLAHAYDLSAKKTCMALEQLCGLPNIHLTHPDNIAKAIAWYRKGLDFADALHLAQSDKRRCLYTFDKTFIKRAKGLSTCRVMEPA
jgi:predicted nucleic-acid-binding protein